MDVNRSNYLPWIITIVKSYWIFKKIQLLKFPCRILINFNRIPTGLTFTGLTEFSVLAYITTLYFLLITWNGLNLKSQILVLGDIVTIKEMSSLYKFLPGDFPTVYRSKAGGVFPQGTQPGSCRPYLPFQILLPGRRNLLIQPCMVYNSVVDPKPTFWPGRILFRIRAFVFT